MVDALEGDGLVAEDANGTPVGLLTWIVGAAGSGPDEAEVRVLVVEEGARGRGVGTALLHAAEAELRRAAVRRAWLLTTNDNTDGLAFYQRRGWRLAELHPGAVDEARASLKPAIAAVGSNGIPIRDELVLRRELESADPGRGTGRATPAGR
ncbi:MAG TPA: GNAT family N-acetyltransferase [Candidatus Limnocylindrales bacterium]|nr:GNAT family N-acetyltransferase [Candidatus Limnocylindrales bacterium]